MSQSSQHNNNNGGVDPPRLEECFSPSPQKKHRRANKLAETPMMAKVRRSHQTLLS
jgi:hypothetical protein